MRMPWASRKTTLMVRCGARKPGPLLAIETRPIKPATAAITIRPTHTSRAVHRVLILALLRETYDSVLSAALPYKLGGASNVGP